MDVCTHAVEDSKAVIENDDLLQEQNSFSLSNTEDIKDANVIISKGESRELEKLSDITEEDHQQPNKSLNVREIHETSPFKQAVKGFVLSKLSKKVGSSHILSGLTEKIVKKLEDKDNSQSVSVHSSESDLSLSNLKIKEASNEDISSSVSCELKSLVANDLALSEALSIEDAMECVEELKSSNDSIETGLNIPQRNDRKEMTRSNSISLPSSPAHRFTKRASSISNSLDNEESPKQFSHSNLTFLCEENKENVSDNKSKKSKHIDEIELKNININKDNLNCDVYENSEISYPNNIYVGEKENVPNFTAFIWTLSSFILRTLRNAYHTLSLTHLFLLASIIVHNLTVIPFILTIMFDTVTIAYVCYSYICAIVQKPVPNKMSNFPFVDPHLGNASIHVQKTNRLVKGSVKLLKGEYDPENIKNISTDLVDINIENSCLKIHTPKKKKDVSTDIHSFTFYDISGATVSLLPKDLSRKRIWNKKYPICIIFPPMCKKSGTSDDLNNTSSTSADYLSRIHDDSSDSEKKALYLFALTDREKESLFWAILKNTEECDDSSSLQTQKTSSKIDFSSMSYISLMDLNEEDSNTQSKDVYDDNKSFFEKANADLEFENYMKKLFENFERMVKFSPRSRSFEDLSNIKDEASRSSDSFISKDDSFLSPVIKEYSVDWLNLALGRLFYDFLTQKYWSDDVKARIQKKLDRIEMPSFIESLEVSDVFLGTSLPQIHTVSNPVVDMNGVWFNFDFNYCGTFQMTLKTKLNIIKAKQLPETEAMVTVESKQSMHSTLSSDSDEEEVVEVKNSSARQKKIFNRIEKWISHKHFQTVAQSKFVKKYVGDLSNMPLTLTVELNTLHGTLVLNIPPAPTDRIWYGFQKDPVLLLNASPKVGTHEINMSSVVQMIEKQLIQEFKKALVMPNMDDLLIPVMYSPVYEL